MASPMQGRTAIFNETGHLSQSGMLAYMKQELAAHDMAAVNAHIEACEWCRHALDGAGMYASPEKFEASLALLLEKTQTSPLPAKKPLPLPRWQSSIAIAASLLLVLGFSFWLVNRQFDPHPTTVAQKESGDAAPRMEPRPEVASPPVISLDTHIAMEADTLKLDLAKSLNEQEINAGFSQGYTAEQPGTSISSGQTLTTSDLEESKGREQVEEDIKANQQAASSAASTYNWSNEGIVADSVATITMAPEMKRNESLELKKNSKGVDDAYYQNSTAPSYSVGETALKDYIDKLVQQKDKGLPTETIKVQLNISAEGKVTNVKFLQAPRNKEVQQRIEKHLLKMPPWRPSYTKGKAMPSTYVYSFTY
ncbi:MAG: hypothetical protein SFW35_06435 [Chitinophagales bacterium]|nr:hypothetical protein [Chitinophagales bacterium]